MKLLILNQYNDMKVKISDILPRVGDRIDLFCLPYPTVSSVLLWPSMESLALWDKDIDAIVTVE